MQAPTNWAMYTSGGNRQLTNAAKTVVKKAEKADGNKCKIRNALVAGGDPSTRFARSGGYAGTPPPSSGGGPEGRCCRIRNSCSEHRQDQNENNSGMIAIVTSPVSSSRGTPALRKST